MGVVAAQVVAVVRVPVVVVVVQVLVVVVVLPQIEGWLAGQRQALPLLCYGCGPRFVLEPVVVVVQAVVVVVRWIRVQHQGLPRYMHHGGGILLR